MTTKKTSLDMTANKTSLEYMSANRSILDSMIMGNCS